MTGRILDIVKGTIADGPGVRNSVYFAGCMHNCPGCHNPESHDFSAGKQMTVEEILDQTVKPHMGITISGGDPFYQATFLCELCKRYKEAGKNVWVFTGYTYDQIKHLPALKYIDVLVDGPYIQELRDLSRFCGSTNQRIIYLKDGKIDHIA